MAMTDATLMIQRIVSITKPRRALGCALLTDGTHRENRRIGAGDHTDRVGQGNAPLPGRTHAESRAERSR